MKNFNDFVNEGYWGCKPLENDYVLDRQSEFYNDILEGAFSGININSKYEDLYFDIAIALDLSERLSGTEGLSTFVRKHQIQDKLLQCLDKVYDGYKDTWTKVKPEEWKSVIDDMKSKVQKIFKSK